MALANSVYFFKHSLPEAEPCDCVKGAMVLYVTEEKVGIVGDILRISGLIPPCDSLPPLLLPRSSFFFSSFLSKETQIP